MHVGVDGAWSNQVVSQVIIVGPSGQLLVYSPLQVDGDLIAAISGKAGNDGLGNIYEEGIGSYDQGTNQGVVLDGGAIEFVWNLDTDALLALITTQVIGGGIPPFLRVGAATGIFLGSSSITAENKIIIVPSGDTTGATDFAVISYALSISLDIELVPGTYWIPNGETLDLRKVGLKFNGAGPRATLIIVAGGSSNAPAMMVAGEGQDIGGFRIGYNSQQPAANTLAACFQLGDDTVGNCFMSHFHDMEWFQGAYSTVINPALVASAGFFSCEFSNISLRSAAISFIFWNSAAGTGFSACTGSVLNNTYCNNDGGSGPAVLTSFGIDIRNFDEIVFNQLNLEHTTINSTDWFNFQQDQNVVINSLHCERLTLAGSTGNSGMFAVGSNTSLVISGMGVYFATINGTVWNPVVRFFGTGSNVSIDGFNEGTTNAFGGASSLIQQWGAFSGADCVLNVLDVTLGSLVSTLATGLPAAGCYAYVQWPGSAVDGWQEMGAPLAGWTAARARYRLLPNGTVLVDINDLSGPALGPADGTVLFSAANGLLAGYAPSGATGCAFHSNGTDAGSLEFETTGAVEVFGINGVGNPRVDGSFTVSVV
jgi:hypothetical protein